MQTIRRVDLAGASWQVGELTCYSSDNHIATPVTDFFYLLYACGW